MVAKIREFRQKGCDLDMAIEEAIEYCLLHDVLKEFLLEHKSEVADMLRMEYDEARTMNHLKEDYYEEGVKDGAMKAKVSLICRKFVSRNNSGTDCRVYGRRHFICSESVRRNR